MIQKENSLSESETLICKVYHIYTVSIPFSAKNDQDKVALFLQRSHAWQLQVLRLAVGNLLDEHVLASVFGQWSPLISQEVYVVYTVSLLYSAKNDRYHATLFLRRSHVGQLGDLQLPVGNLLGGHVSASMLG